MFSFGRVFTADRACKCVRCGNEIKVGENLIYEFNCKKRWHPLCAYDEPGNHRFAEGKALTQDAREPPEAKAQGEKPPAERKPKQEPAPSSPPSDEIAQLRESMARMNERVDELVRFVEYLEGQIKGVDLLS